MEQSTVLILTAFTLGQIGLSSSILIFRSTKRQAYLPLAIFLIATGIIASSPVISTLAPALQPLMTALALPALLLLAPGLWLYVSGLTCEIPWRFQLKHAWHLTPFIISLITVIIGISLPQAMQEAVLIQGNENGFTIGTNTQNLVAIVTTTAAFILLIGWVFQSATYFFYIARRLSRYRSRLKDLFASNESRELTWLSWLLCAVGASWLIMVITLLSDDVITHVHISRIPASLVILLTVWSLSAWGLRQKPGFEELYNEGKNEVISDLNDEKMEQKYERSALDLEQSKRIAQKIEISMKQNKLYLDASLSLQKLSQHISVAPNYISQTLNETIGMKFFDYVNKYRIEAAMPLILADKDTVLDIAMTVGFNARSSFYTAFKKETSKTPSDFREDQQ